MATENQRVLIELAELKARFDSLDEDVKSLRDLNMTVGEQIATTRVILHAQNDITAEIGKLRDEMNEKLMAVAAAQSKGPDIKTLGTFFATIVVPIILALIAAYVSLKTGLPHGK